MARVFTLSATDLVFLWEQCPRCFYLKIASRLPPPRLPLPRIFNEIDRRMKERFAAWLARGAIPDLPDGRPVPLREVCSAPVPVGRVQCVLRGQPDAVLRLADGSYAVVDFKTAPLEPDLLERYHPQLHAYAWALERPTHAAHRYAPVTRLGLLVFAPAGFRSARPGRASLAGQLRWVPLPRDDRRFRRLLTRVAAVLDGRRPPPAAPDCPICRYHKQAPPP